jgi:hypothetical protein
MKTEALLAGRIFDDRGNRMRPTYARKRGIKYRYYVSCALLEGFAAGAGSIGRVPAIEIETLILQAVRGHLKLTHPLADRSLVDTHIIRVDVEPGQLTVTFTGRQKSGHRSKRPDKILHVPWHKPPSKRRREIIELAVTGNQRAHPLRSETRAVLIASIARGRRWLNELLTDPSATTECIAARETCSVRRINMTISLAFLAPSLVKGAIDGRLPQGMGVARLCDMPAEWSRQYQALGLAPQ